MLSHPGPGLLLMFDMFSEDNLGRFLRGLGNVNWVHEEEKKRNCALREMGVRHLRGGLRFWGLRSWVLGAEVLLRSY